MADKWFLEKSTNTSPKLSHWSCSLVQCIQTCICINSASTLTCCSVNHRQRRRRNKQWRASFLTKFLQLPSNDKQQTNWTESANQQKTTRYLQSERWSRSDQCSRWVVPLWSSAKLSSLPEQVNISNHCYFTAAYCCFNPAQRHSYCWFVTSSQLPRNVYSPLCSETVQNSRKSQNLSP